MNTAPERLNVGDKQESAPTILVATDEGRRHVLAQTLRSEGYLLFEANDEAEALHIVISQARTINILMTDADIPGYNLARSLKRYRHEMIVMFVTNHPEPSLSDGLTPATALARVRKVLKLPKEIAAQARWDSNGGDCILAAPLGPWDGQRLPKQALRAAK